MPITLGDVHAVYRSSKRVTPRMLDRVVAALGAELPRGFREFLTRLGHGWVNDWLQFYCPDARLIENQRSEMLRQFEDDRLGAVDCRGAKLTRTDIASSIQLGIVTDVRYLFACPRFPGSLFDWSERTIVRHRKGIEALDPFAALDMDKFAYFIPLNPVSENGSLVCQSKRLAVTDAVQALERHCRGTVHIVDIGRGTPAYWIFPARLGAMFHVFARADNPQAGVRLKYRASPKAFARVQSVIEEVEGTLQVRFKPAANTRRSV